MTDTIKLQTFPATRFEALAILYLQNQDLSGKTPEEIMEMYLETEQALKKADIDIKGRDWKF